MSEKTSQAYDTAPNGGAGIVSEAVRAIRKKDRFNYADYCTWDDDKRWELIDGSAYAMSAPTWMHQSILVELAGQMRDFLKGKPCKVFVAPFDVRLNADAGDDTVVQPDIVLICDRDKLIGTGCIGAPDMAIEILSPSTAIHDTVLKLKLYRQHGVREYWTVDPDTKTTTTHTLSNGRYLTTTYTAADAAPVHILEGCKINLSEVFEEWG